MSRAARYSRVSREEQAEGFSIDVQMERMAVYASEHVMSLVEETSTLGTRLGPTIGLRSSSPVQGGGDRRSRVQTRDGADAGPIGRSGDSRSAGDHSAR